MKFFTLLFCLSACRRPPHGGRGLKLVAKVLEVLLSRVAPRTGGVD